MKKEDIAADKLVQDTVQAFEAVIAEKRANNQSLPGPEYFESRGNHENPMLRVLEETEALDPVSAAVMAVENYRGWVAPADIAGKIDAQVAEAITLSNSNEMLLNPETLIATGNPAAIKLMIASIAALTTGKEFEEMKAEVQGGEVSVVLGALGGPVADIAEHLSESGNWKNVPPLLLDRYMEGLSNLAEMSQSKTQKRVLTSVITELKEQIAKGTAAEVTALSKPPQIDPDSPFMKLKTQAKKLKF